MGFLSFRKKSKANKALSAHSPSPPSPLVLNDNVNTTTTTTTTTTTDAESDYHSPIADSFMMVGSSIVDMAQSSLSEDIFKELVPLSSIKSESSTKDTIRHSLSLKSNNNSSVKSSVLPLRVNTAIPVHNDSTVQSPLNESIISSTTTRSSKQSDSSESSLTSLSSTEEFVPLHPISRSDPRHYASKKLGEHAPLIDLVNRSSPHEQAVVPTMPSVAATTTTVPGLAMERMKERHRQEYRRSMQWSPPTQSLPNAPPPPPPSAAAMMEYHSSFFKRANSSTNQRTLSMQQHHSPPLPPPPQVQVPLIDQIKPVAAVPMRSMSSSTYTSKPFDKRPLIASIPPLVSYQQPTKPVPDHRHYRLSNQQVQPPHPSAAAAMQYQQAETRHPRQQRFMGGGTSIPEQPYQQEPSRSSKLKTDYRRIVYTRKQNYVPDLVDLLDHQDEQQQQQQQQQQQASFSHCSHHQPHHTLIKRHYKNTDSCQQQQQPTKHHYPTTHHCNHHHHHHRHYTHCHHNRKSNTCYDYNTTSCC